MAKPEYAAARERPGVRARRQPADHGHARHADHPLFIGQGANGELEGTPGDKPGIGKGDGVMIAGDVRTLARQYCAAGVKVQYTQYDLLSHVTSAVPWLGEAVPWLTARFTACRRRTARVAPGNALDPIPEG